MSAELPSYEDAFMRAAFDLSFKFAPIVKPPEMELHAVEVQAATIALQCECGAGCAPKYNGRIVEFPPCPNNKQ